MPRERERKGGQKVMKKSAHTHERKMERGGGVAERGVTMARAQQRQ